MNNEDLILSRLRKLRDFEYFAKTTLKIKSESGDLKPFLLNPAQQKFNRIWEETKKSGKKLWFIIYKPRQLGFSTYVQARIFHHNFFNSNQKALTMGHKSDASNNLFEIYNRYYKNFPDPLKPTLRKSNEKKISYDKLGSENKVDTAVAGEVGRSDTFQVVHLTEFAFYPDPKTTLAGLMQGSKYAKIFVIETTANGFNLFRDKWIDAINGIGDFIPFFISWLEFPLYQQEMNEAERELLQKDLGLNTNYNEYDGEENTLVNEFGATLEQLKWRRWAIDTLCDRDIAIFHQEYPNTWEEGFIASGRPVFDLKTCIENMNKCKEPIRIGNLEPVYNTEDEKYKRAIAEGRTSYADLKDFIKEIRFVDTPKGFIKVFNEIELLNNEYYKYAGAADVAEGLAQGDFSDMPYLNRKTMNVDFVWHGHIHPDLLAEEQHKIQTWLKGNCYVNTEMNNHGLTTITAAHKLGVNQYYRQTFDKGWVEDQGLLGTKTTVSTKPYMINNLNSFIREGLFTDNEKEFWGECLTFVKNDRGQMQAQEKDKDPGTKCYDDRVMSRALMIQCHHWMPAYYIKPIDNRPEWQKKLEKRKKQGLTPLSV